MDTTPSQSARTDGTRSRADARDSFPANRLVQGRFGTILEIRGSSDETLRLKALGICRGRRVQLLRRGDPLILRVFGSRIGLSSRLAAKVYVVADLGEHPEGGES